MLNAEVKLFCGKRMFRTDSCRDGETEIKLETLVQCVVNSVVGDFLSLNLFFKVLNTCFSFCIFIFIYFYSFCL